MPHFHSVDMLVDPAKTLFVAPMGTSALSTSNFLSHGFSALSVRHRSRPTLAKESIPAYPCMRYIPDPAEKHQTSQPNTDKSKEFAPPEEEVPPPSTPIGSNMFRVDPDAIQSDSEENLRGFIKTRGSLVPGEEFVFWWVGDIYDIVDGQTSRHLFSFEGYNIGRMIRVDGGWRMLTREVGLYKDTETGEILNTWQNPETGATNKCVHVWNDPVNQQFLLERNGRKFKVPTTMQGEDIYWHSEIFLKYKSPLTRKEFPENAQSDTYQSTEMFQFFSKKEDLASEGPSADCLISWVRVGQWLPWMEMGDRPGRLVYHCRGRKLKNGFADLSETVRSYILEHHPEYASAPTNFTSPNETSWTYMKKLLDAKGSPRADGTIARPEPKKSGETVNTSDPSEAFNTVKPRKMNSDELAEFCGSDLDKPIYLSVAGRIFDVSSASRHYRKGETYNCLTGRDASHAFISGDLSEAGLLNNLKTDLKNLTKDQQSDLDRWVAFFAKTYPEVGELVDF